MLSFRLLIYDFYEWKEICAMLFLIMGHASGKDGRMEEIFYI
jgi:hypothetical protein